MEEDKDHLRANIYLSQVHNLSKTSSLFVTLYYQPQIDKMNNYRVRLQSGIDVQLTEVLSLSITFNASHDTGFT